MSDGEKAEEAFMAILKRVLPSSLEPSVLWEFSEALDAVIVARIEDRLDQEFKRGVYSRY